MFEDRYKDIAPESQPFDTPIFTVHDLELRQMYNKGFERGVTHGIVIGLAIFGMALLIFVSFFMGENRNDNRPPETSKTRSV